MQKTLQCLRCGCEINHIKRQKLQLGQTDWLFGDLPNLFAGAIEVDIYSCPDCGKLEFFTAEEPSNELPQRRCPKCGKQHDFDYPKCPFCKYDYS